MWRTDLGQGAVDSGKWISSVPGPLAFPPQEDLLANPLLSAAGNVVPHQSMEH